MAHFYGWMQGSRKEVTRMGHKASGMRSTVAGWGGAVRVQLYEHDGVDYARVTLGPHPCVGGDTRTLYDGPLSGWRMES